ncbi:hypothetical protein BBJ28_00022917, partial [Nothophytophthora sp. Chile5]
RSVARTAGRCCLVLSPFSSSLQHRSLWSMRIVCVSDTHGLHEQALRVPDGDVFIHAGDFTDTGERDEVLAFNAFLGKLPHRYKIVIAGNHESTFDRQFYPRYWQQYGHRQQYGELGRLSLTTPWQPEFCNWAFNLPRGDALLRKWRRIPTDTDVLVTHTPPMGQGDRVGYQNVGCADLLREVETRIHPKLHVFGHVHEGYGRSMSADGVTTYFNASACTHNYEPVNKPFVFDLRLRLCSQKAVFVEEKVVAVGDGGAATVDGKTRLRAFRVDGTTSGLLFESTLKLRPVVDMQKRALRYLFSQGFSSNTSNYETQSSESGAAAAQDRDATDSTTSMEVDSEGSVPSTDRRRSGLSRRVTVAVLDDISESKEMMNGLEREQLQQASVAAAGLGKDVSTDSTLPAGRPRRSRRDKTLQRRSAVSKLAALTEEPSAEADETMSHDAPEPKASETVAVSVALVVAPPVVECVLCKYNVPGHVHPGAEPAEPAPSPVEEAAKSDEKGGTNPQQTKGENPRNIASKRLSSWF